MLKKITFSNISPISAQNIPKDFFIWMNEWIIMNYYFAIIHTHMSLIWLPTT